MKLFGFNFTKIQIEKFKERVEGLKINTKIDISDIKEAKAGILKTKEELLTVKFVYGLDYEPEMAKVELEGNLIVSLESKRVKEILKEWKKKKMPEDFRTTLFNVILRKSGLKALQLEEEMNLPIHMQMPTLKLSDKKE